MFIFLFLTKNTLLLRLHSNDCMIGYVNIDITKYIKDSAMPIMAIHVPLRWFSLISPKAIKPKIRDIVVAGTNSLNDHPPNMVKISGTSIARKDTIA
jgi:hypothetical protein